MQRFNSQKRIIVVGGNAAGPAAAAKAKRTAPDAEVTMIEAGEFISTGTCELPYVLSGEIKNYEDVVFYSASSFESEKGVRVLTGHHAEKINRPERVLVVKDLKSGQKLELNYDKLILCTGSKAKTLAALPNCLVNSFTLKSVSDLLAIKNYIERYNAKKVLIIGAGYIGLETADALHSLGCDVTILEKENLPLPGAENETRNLVLDLLNQKKVNFIGSAKDVRFRHDENKFLSIKYEGRSTEYDLVITSIGFEPNNALAVSAKLSIGSFGGIKVDQKLRTSDPNIFAAGDCTEVVNRVTGKPDYFPLATYAHQSGHTAGENAAGGNAVIHPVVKNIAVELFGRSLVTVGLSSAEAKKYRYNFASVNAVAQNLVMVMPAAENVFGKIIFDKSSKQILGANFFGSNEVVGYGDLISTYIHNKIRATELANVNYNYTPPLSPFVNILSVLGRKIERELK